MKSVIKYHIKHLQVITMSDDGKLTLDDMTPAPKRDYMAEHLDISVAREYALCSPGHKGQFNNATINAILGSLEHGCSVNTAVMAAGVMPTTFKGWLEEGRVDYESLTNEQIEAAPNFDSLLTPKAKFYLQVYKTKGDSILTMHNALFDRIHEAGWIPQWFLTIMEPERYNLKYRMFKESQQAAGGGSGQVNFVFIDGAASRDPEERSEIDKALTELKEQYKSSDLVIAKQVNYDTEP